MVRRHLVAGLLCTVVGAGCHAGRPSRGVATTEAPIGRTDVTAARFVEQHNQNAEAIRSLTAHPRINTVSDGGRQRFVGRANGDLALDGEKNFRLEINTVIKQVADIGSNEDGFWFWSDDDPSRSVYVCDYRDIDSCQLGVTLQPDWIMEAMGLRRFTDAEARTMHSKPGVTPGTLILTQSRKDAKGQLLTKETLVDEATLRIKEHRLFAGPKKDLLASAVVSQYRPYKAPATGDTGTDLATPAIVLPDKLRLTWVMDKDRFTLDITMANVQINPSFEARQRAKLFAEPTIAGTTRQNLALLDPATAPAAHVYESRPIPRTGAIRLGTPEPVPLGTEGTVRRQIDPMPLSPDLSSTPAQPAGVVGAVLPRGSYLGGR